MTKGKFQLHVRLVNPDDGDGYPRWIELPRTKADYARIASDNRRLKDRFWDDAYNAAWNAVQCWNPRLNDPENVTCGASNLSGYAIKDLPNSANFSWQRLVRRKVVYLYSGATFTDENTTYEYQLYAGEDRLLDWTSAGVAAPTLAGQAAGAVSSFAVGGLPHGQPYAVVVRAANPAGAGAVAQVAARPEVAEPTLEGSTPL
jgi:hypothetical protein